MGALALMASACASHDAGSTYADVASGGWAYGDTVTYVPRVKAAQRGLLHVIVRHDDDYPFANLWLELSDSTGRCDTLDIRLADAYGHWQGTGMGGSYQCVSLPIPVEAAPGRAMRLRHIMRVDTLRHIQQIGMEFRTHE